MWLVLSLWTVLTLGRGPLEIPESVEARLEVQTPRIADSGEFRAELTLAVRRNRVFWIDPQVANVASLTLEVEGPDGTLVPHGPPPVPRRGKVVGVRRGKPLRWQLVGLAIDRAYLPSGRYRVRWKAMGRFGAQRLTVTSAWKEFTVGAAGGS